LDFAAQVIEALGDLLRGFGLSIHSGLF
jgi:hypothetical protein